MRALALLALLAALVAGCGANEVAADPFAEAATKTEAVESMRVDMSMTTTIPGVADPVTMEMTGVVAGDRAAMTTTIPPIQGVELGEMEVRLFGTVMYMRMPFLEEAGSGLKPWVELDMQKLGADLGVDFQALLEAGRQSDPTQSLQMLRAAGGEVEEVGEARVRGVRTTHYRGTVDFERYADTLERQESGRAAARSIRQLVKLTGQKTVPVEIWVDEESLVRRMKWEQAMPGAGGKTATAAATMELYDFGAEVEVVRPPADQTMSFEELQELGEG